MVVLRCSVVFVGMVVGGRGAACCRQPMGRRSCFDPCMPGWLGVGRLACGLFIVGSLSCSSLVRSRLCSPRRCSPTSFSLSSRFVLRVAAAGLSGAVDVLRPGRARCLVLVRRRWFASGRPVCVVWWPVWAQPAVFVAVVVPTLLVSRRGCCFAVCPVSGHLRVWLLCFWHYCGWYVIVCAAQRQACPAVGCVGAWRSCRVYSGPSSCVGPVGYVVTVRRPLMVGCVLSRRKVASIGTTV